MNETKPVPEPVKTEALNLTVERLSQQMQESFILIQELMMANSELEQHGKIMAEALVEIQNIKGSPPIQVAKTIATRAISKCAELIVARHLQHDNQNNQAVHGGPKDIEGTAERQAGNLPS